MELLSCLPLWGPEVSQERLCKLRPYLVCRDLEGWAAPSCSSLVPELIILAEARKPWSRDTLTFLLIVSFPGRQRPVLLSFFPQPNLHTDDGYCIAQGSEGLQRSICKKSLPSSPNNGGQELGALELRVLVDISGQGIWNSYVLCIHTQQHMVCA